MRSNKFFSAVLACCVAAIGLGGCGRSDGKIVVEGTVTLDGQPLEKATVAFIGNQGGSIASGPTNRDGKFSIAAVPGPNKVVVNKLAPGDDGGFSMPQIASDEDESTSGLAGVDVGVAPSAAKPKTKTKGIIDSIFTAPGTTPFEVTVEKGMDALVLAVQSP